MTKKHNYEQKNTKTRTNEHERRAFYKQVKLNIKRQRAKKSPSRRIAPGLFIWLMLNLSQQSDRAKQEIEQQCQGDNDNTDDFCPAR